MTRILSFFIMVFASCVQVHGVLGADVLRPQIDGAWWQVAGDPDLGDYTSPNQQPVDFGIWQAQDGTWQIWSCIRGTKCGGKTRLFHRWEGVDITDADWRPMGIAMEADTKLGETQGGLQAPHVIKQDGKYRMFYGDWRNICLAESEDGKNFQRVLSSEGRPQLFSGPFKNTRDAMVLKVGDQFYCYYTAHLESPDPEGNVSAIFCRISSDLRNWGDAVKVSAGCKPGEGKGKEKYDAECPFVVRKDNAFYLFRNQLYGENNLNTQYRSTDPTDFGVNDDQYRVGQLPVAAPEIVHHNGQDYVAALMPSLKGIRIAKIKWVRQPRE